MPKSVSNLETEYIMDIYSTAPMKKTMTEVIPSARVVERSAESKAMPAVRRSQLETRMDMLRAVHDGAEGPTQVMYKANLSWSALQENLTSLLTVGLLREEKFGSRRKYVLTEKGMEVLHNFDEIDEDIVPTYA